MVNPEDEAKIREIIDQAINQGPKTHRIVRVTGLLKTPGRIQYEMRHLSFTVEEDLPADRKRSDIVREICQDLGPLVLEFEPSSPKTLKDTPAPADRTSVETPELDAEYLDELGWKAFKTGGGEWIGRDTKGAKALADAIVKVGGSIVIGSFRYRISKGEDREFINRYPSQEATRR